MTRKKHNKLWPRPMCLSPMVRRRNSSKSTVLSIRLHAMSRLEKRSNICLLRLLEGPRRLPSRMSTQWPLRCCSSVGEPITSPLNYFQMNPPTPEDRITLEDICCLMGTQGGAGFKGTSLHGSGHTFMRTEGPPGLVKGVSIHEPHGSSYSFSRLQVKQIAGRFTGGTLGG
jgi:hypothetical protein